MALNVTDFLENHPGGPKAILLYAGKDATEEFNMLHDKNVIEVRSPSISSANDSEIRARDSFGEGERIKSVIKFYLVFI
jgi:cytochrome b involved in lipid metabolism